MAVRIFTSSLLRDTMEESKLQLIVSQFKFYKETGNPGEIFGRDVSFNRPEKVKIAELQHIHMNEGRKWGVRLLQMDRTSDIHIVYCQNYFHPNCFLLISIVKNAHAKYRDNLFMLNLAEIAEEFRSRHF